MLEIYELNKKFGDKEVVKNINFKVDAQEVLCILGPNGAGKSTTINMLTGTLAPNGGKILFAGKPIQENLQDYKQVLGVVPQEIALYEELTALQNITFFASLYNIPKRKLNMKCMRALEYVGLGDRAKDRVKTYSGGMKRRLNIACAIVHEPEIIIMDEPTVGIDPQSRNRILDTIRDLRDQGKTIIYTTHYMEEVEAISTRIIIMDHGDIIARGTKESLKAEMGDIRTFTITVEDGRTINSDAIYSIEGIKEVKIQGESIKVTSLLSIENLDQVIAVLIGQNIKIQSIQTAMVNLEHVFLDLTGRTLRD